MKKKYIDLFDEPFEKEFAPHSIEKYERLFHMTLKTNMASIEKEGLVRFKPQYKSLVQTDLLFFSYPIDNNSSDLFRFSSEFHAVVVVDAKKLAEAGYEFYDDTFASQDASSKRNHLVIDRDIPKEFILKIVTF